MRGCNAIQSVGCLWPRCSFLLQTTPHPNQSEGSLTPQSWQRTVVAPSRREGDATWALEKPHFYFPSQFINQHLSLQLLSELASFLSFHLCQVWDCKPPPPPPVLCGGGKGSLFPTCFLGKLKCILKFRGRKGRRRREASPDLNRWLSREESSLPKARWAAGMAESPLAFPRPPADDKLPFQF